MKLSEEQRSEQIKRLYEQKSELLDKHGIFGGGQNVNMQHRAINSQLESLGVLENETLTYEQYFNS